MSEQQQIMIYELYEQNHAKLYAYARARTKSESDAEDAVQETFCIACTRIEIVQESPNQAGWLMNVMKNVLHKLWNLHSREQVAAELELSILAEDIHAMSQLRMAEFAAMLTDSDFQLLSGIAHGRTSSEDMALLLGVRAAACRKRWQRLRSKLQQTW